MTIETTQYACRDGLLIVIATNLSPFFHCSDSAGQCRTPIEAQSIARADSRVVGSPAT